MKAMYKEKNYQTKGTWKCPKIYQPLHPSKAAANIDRACAIVGNAAELSRILDFAHPSTVNKWKERGGCPSKDAWRIEIITCGEVKAQEVSREPIYRHKF